MKPGKNSHCGYCGQAYPTDAAWPRACAGCQHVTYRNPIPVAVLLLPVDSGLLCIRRGIEPRKGQLALPGGYVDHAETWQQAAARELFEETGITINAAQVSDFHTRSGSAGESVILIFGTGPRLISEELPTFKPTNETVERLVIREPRELAFPLHTEAAREFFARRRGSRA